MNTIKKPTISFILVILSILFSFAAESATVSCAKIGRYYRPVSTDAVKLADYLKVKTCTGKTFKKVLKAKGIKMTVVGATPEIVKKYDLKSEQGKRIEAFSF